MLINEYTIEALVLGGAFLGGGGGGSPAEGRRLGRAAVDLGRPEIVSIDSIPEPGLLATVSAVGAPAAKERLVLPEDFVKAVQLLTERTGQRLSGLISSENGGTSTLNGLVQSAVLGIPVVDAPCNGRAHPTGVMGSMGLGEVAGFVSRQAAAGGNPEARRHLELYVEGPLSRADAMVRRAAVECGGLIAVARNPVEAGYVRTHGAPGALRMALSLGDLILRERSAGGPAVGRALAAALEGTVIACGPVGALELETRGGYDVGRIVVDDVELAFWNEYMTLERRGARLATFPDLIATLDARDGTPRTSADLEPGTPVVVMSVPRRKLILGSGMFVPDNLRAVERVLNRPML